MSGNGVGCCGMLHGVGGCEGEDRAVRRPDGEGGVERVDLVGERMEPERASLAVVLPEYVRRPPRLRRLFLVHRPQAGPLVEGAQRRRAVMQPRHSLTH